MGGHDPGTHGHDHGVQDLQPLHPQHDEKGRLGPGGDVFRRDITELCPKTGTVAQKSDCNES
jgi:hypothetical protein